MPSRKTARPEKSINRLAENHDLKQSKNALHTSEERLALERLDLAASAAHLGIWDWDIPNNKLVWDKRMYELYGLKPKDFSGAYEAWLAGIHPDDRGVSDNASRLAVLGERNYDTEFRVVWPDGTVRHLKAFGLVVRDDDGKPIRMTGVNFDITERKRAENLLAVQHGLALALNNAPNLETGLQLCLDAALNASGMDCGGIYLVNATGGLTLMVHKGLSPAFIDSASSFDAQSPNGRLVFAGKPVYTEHTLLGIPLDDRRVKEMLRAVAVIPVMYESRVIGCFNMGSHTRDDAPDFTRSALETIAAQIGSNVARLKTEESLRLRESYLSAIIENQPGLLWMKDRAGLFLAVNTKFSRSCGLDCPELLIGKTDFDIWPRELAARYVEDDVKVMKAEKPCSVEEPISDRGDIHWFETFKAPIMDAQGMVIGTTGFSRDITERKQAEEALRKSEERYRLLIETTDTGYVIIDDTGAVLDANREYVRLSGHEKLEEILGRSVMEWTAHEEKETNARAVDICARNGLVRNLEIAYVDKKGNRTPVEINATAMDVEGGPRILALCRDITERKQAAQALSISQERYRLLYEHAPVGILLMNRSGSILEVNSAAVQILGSPSAEATKEINVLTLPLLIEAGIAAAFRRCVETGEVVFGEHPYSTKWGKSIHMHLRFVPIFDDCRQVNLVHTIIENITDRKRMEEELQKNQKLESLGVLAGGIAHDFNNLLAGIFGNIDLARSVSKDAQAIEYLKATLATMNRARALTLQLLTFAKGGAPVQKITPLIPFIQETARFALSGSNISCVFSMDENLRPCNIDKNQIGQVIDNIVINALQAMPSGGTIEISARNILFGEKEHPSLVKGDYVKVSVKDTGIGIPKDIMPRIFDPFYTTKTKGHGLGLATCYSIIKRHGGAIDVESEPGKGSVFHVYLPASSQPASEDAAMPVVKQSGGGTVIVADDEEILRVTVQKMLESIGYSAVCKNDGGEAVDFYVRETAAGRRVAAMIFDLTIPGGMGGVEAVQEIRKLDKDLPVFVASGYADNSVMKNPVRYGFTASICKPFTIAELSEMLKKN
jgi:PAS domain S-box-containing protein